MSSSGYTVSHHCNVNLINMEYFLLYLLNKVIINNNISKKKILTAYADHEKETMNTVFKRRRTLCTGSVMHIFH